MSAIPQLAFDGDCGFCRYCVDYAASLTGPRVAYRPYQEIAGDHPDVPEQAFRDSIQLFESGRRCQGAEAAFRVLAIGGRSTLLRAYRRVPGFAAGSEAAYRWVARHRPALFALGRLMFGRRLLVARHERTAAWLYRTIMLLALVAFVSLWVQVEGLFGQGGIAPVAEMLDALSAPGDFARYFRLPTLLWISGADWALHGVCALGVLASLLGLAGRLRTLSAAIAYLAYLSLVTAGRDFTAFQWDMLLLECLVLAAVAARSPGAGVWLGRLLLLRFMLLSGVVKVASHDPTWASGTALLFHFETQPLPTPLAWYAHHLPREWLIAATWATLLIELGLPWLVLGPRNLRLLAAAGFVLLEVLIVLTGNYNFFNLLTIGLCLALLNDHLLPGSAATERIRRRPVAGMIAIVIGALGVLQILDVIERLPPTMRAPLRLVAPYGIVNRYGVFAVMTTVRHEIVLEGSLDGEHWREYAFPFKPGAVDEAPRLATPHQPRLDWQMWFAALGPPDRSPWFYGLADALLRGDPETRALLRDPFDGRTPTWLRARYYRYRFTTPAERAATGDWWVRELLGLWMAPIRLRVPHVHHDPLVLP